MHCTAISIFISICCIFKIFAHSSSDSPPDAHRKTICLNMIVKNESAVIERCLGSIKNFIDYWVIYDTGSTDGTQKIIKDFLKDIPGELHQSSWVDFAHNRNEALKAAKGKADYLLFIDADEIWVYSHSFTLPKLDKDFYHITVRQLEAADIKRIGLINNHLDWKWEGVLHEIITCPQAITYETLQGVRNICNSAIGARSKNPDKYMHDAAVFEKALKTDPNNSRYMFFLGQSYLAADQYELARQAFEKRLAMKSADIQETYMAIYNLGIIQKNFKNLDAALQYFFKAHEFRPTRAEPLFQIAKIYREKGNFLLGYLVAKYSLAIPYPQEDVCVEYIVYDYARMIEFANCVLLLGKYEEGFQACQELLNNPHLPEEMKSRVTSNYELAKKKLQTQVSKEKTQNSG